MFLRNEKENYVAQRLLTLQLKFILAVLIHIIENHTNIVTWVKASNVHSL